MLRFPALSVPLVQHGMYIFLIGMNKQFCAMKQTLLVLTIALSAVAVQAQQWSIGPTVGASHSWMNNTVAGDDESKGVTGFNVGIIMNYSSLEHFGIGTGTRYSQEGIVTRRNGVDMTTRLDYLRFPLHFYYYGNSLEDRFRPKIYVGPSVGFLVGGKTEMFSENGVVEVDSRDVHKSVDVGLLIGTGFNYRITDRTWLNLDLAYTHGLIDVVESGEGKNRNVHLNLGLAWGF